MQFLDARSNEKRSPEKPPVPFDLRGFDAELQAMLRIRHSGNIRVK
jgi:hypothetical protein